jgi:protein-arginine kinase activator protein McsA
MTSRICNNCQQRKNNSTGTQFNNAGGLTYKWFCKDCTEKKDKHEQDKSSVASSNLSTKG